MTLSDQFSFGQELTSNENNNEEKILFHDKLNTNHASTTHDTIPRDSIVTQCVYNQLILTPLPPNTVRAAREQQIIVEKYLLHSLFFFPSRTRQVL